MRKNRMNFDAFYLLLIRLLDIVARNGKMDSNASQKALRNNFSIYLVKVNTDVSKGNQMSNIAKYHISSEMCHYLTNYYR